MGSTARTEVPYEKQPAEPRDRMCGAAALCMVYRSLGLACSQSEVWTALAQKDARGHRCTRTYLLAADALRRGLSSLVIQASDPWRILELCRETAVRVILNHRAQVSSPEGHYSVLVDLTDQHVILHDPQVGPGRRLDRAAFLALWRPSWSRSEITGQVLVAIASGASDATACPQCGQEVPPSLLCRRCHNPVPLQPASILGCMDPTCPAATWKRLFCPTCDLALP